MLEFGQRPPYETFVALHQRLLHRPADYGAVSLLGQAVSDVLDSGCPDEDVQKVIADLEAARATVKEGELDDANWELPLTSLLGLLNQNMHNRAVGAAALNPKSPTLRDKVLAAIDAGVDMPSAIGAEVCSPTTIVSLVLSDLVDEGQVEPAEPIEDEYQRRYRRGGAADHTTRVDDAAEDDEEKRAEDDVEDAAEDDEEKRAEGPEVYG
jgi:hypothetical protein